MPHNPALNEWNWYIVMLSQALIGAISNNVRKISLQFTDDAWIIHTILANESTDDEEEMFEVADDLLTYIDDVKNQISVQTYKKIAVKVSVSKKNLTVVTHDKERIIFKKKE